VLCVDNFATDARLNIAHVLPHPKFELLHHDVTLPLYVEVDEIYKLACHDEGKRFAGTLFFNYRRQHGE